VKILLEYGGRPDVENKRHLTPIDNAHNLHVLKLLVSVDKTLNNSKPVTQDKESDNCADKGHTDTAVGTEMTLDFADDSTKSSNGVVNKLGKRRHGIHCQSTEQMKKVEKLLRAIELGDTRLACFYVGLDGPVSNSSDSEVDPPTSVKSLCHPLCICEKCKPDIADVFEDDLKLDKDIVNINICNSDGFTPLHIASMHGHTDMVRLLLDAGAWINVVSRTRGLTPLHLACQNHCTEVAKLLLQSGDCDLDIPDSRGNTALHYASIIGNTRLVELILKHSPILDMKNSSGKTPLDEAEEKMALTIVRLLRGGKTDTSLPWEEKQVV
jgi:ankyrin repeat protein